eukprot:TRINITY_DN7876_c0_g5_i1.p1 TRINITY_DN7876_c0_g5~~TRINITY_DN7876_c0_g5_i1.p1  ORF type:complete len:1137 (+),score=301.98 TRINITY_DN7876_c0_g5_i1:23-3412(+)
MPPKKKQKATQDNSDKPTYVNLVGLVKDGGSMQPEIRNVLDRAGEDGNEAVATLVNFVIASSGLKEVVEGWQIGHDDTKNVLGELGNRVREKVSEKYPLASREKKWEKFKYNYQNFWRQLMKAIEKEGILYTSDFTDQLIKWLSGLTTSSVRAFRHHAMVAMYNMMTAMSKLAASLIGLNAKLSDKGKKKSSTRTEAEVGRKLSRMKTLLETSYDITCLSRHKDIVPELRSLSIMYQHEWTVAYPELFVSDDYTKVLGWALHYKDDDMRFNALKCLQDIFSRKESFPKMTSWLNKFINRIVEMTLDLATSVSIQALSLAATLITLETEHNKEIFSDSIHDGFVEFIYDEKASIRQAAAPIFHLVMSRRAAATQPGKKSKKASQAAGSKEYLETIVNWMEGKEVELVPACIVEGLTNVEAYSTQFKTPVFADFKVLMDIAESEESEDETVHAALRLLLAIARKAHGKLDLTFPSTHDKILTIPKSKRTKLDKAWTAPNDSILSSLNESLPTFLPAALVRLQTDETSVEILTQIIHVVDPAVWSTGGEELEKSFDELLAICEKLFLTRIREETVDSIAIAWRQLTAMNHPLKEKAHTSLVSIAAKLAKKPKGSGSKASAKHSWMRIAAALEANLDLVDHVWSRLLDALADPDTAMSEHSPEVIAAAVAGLLIRTHKFHKKDDESINLAEDLQAVEAGLLNMLDLESEVPLATQAFAFRGLTNVWAVGCGLDILPQPTIQKQNEFITAFDKLVPNFHPKVTRTVAHNIAVEREMLSHVMCVIKMLMLEYIDSKWAATVLVKWPNLPAKAQEEVKKLHKSYGKTVYLLEEKAIMFANHQYYEVGEEDVEAAEGVIKSICVKLAQQNGVGKGEETEGATKLLQLLEKHASENTKNCFVLHAAIPFVRYMKKPDAKKMLVVMQSRGYDPNSTSITSFITALKRRAGEKIQEEHTNNETAKTAKTDDASLIKASRSTTGTVPRTKTSVSSQRKRLLYDDDDDESAVGTPTPKHKKQKKKQAEQKSDLAPSSLDFSMNFDGPDNTPNKEADTYSMTFSSLEASSQGSRVGSSSVVGKLRSSVNTVTSEVFPASTENDTENVFVASESDEDDDDDEDEEMSPVNRRRISTVRKPLRQG